MTESTYSFSNDVYWENVQSMMTTAQTFQKVMNIPQEQIEQLYAVAYNNYTAGNYADAIVIFKSLCVYVHNDYRFWFGLGASLQGAEQYQDAVLAYSHAALAKDLRDPEPLFHAAQCFINLTKKDEARNVLIVAQTIAKNNPGHDEMLAKIDSILDLLK